MRASWRGPVSAHCSRVGAAVLCRVIPCGRQSVHCSALMRSSVCSRVRARPSKLFHMRLPPLLVLAALGPGHLLEKSATFRDHAFVGHMILSEKSATFRDHAFGGGAVPCAHFSILPSTPQ